MVGFKFDYTIETAKDGSSIVSYFGMIWSSQIKKLDKYGDLLIIDSTFNVNTCGYNAIVISVIDNSLRTCIVAIGFVKNEYERAYNNFLNFIRVHRQIHE